MNLLVKLALAIVAAATIPGCSQANLAEEKWLMFRCPDGRSVSAQFEPKDEFVSVRFDGRDLRLPHVISGSGARYSDGKTTFWNKGRSALVEVDEKVVVQDCVLEGEPRG
jgi:membrane-bound inhibitor of C-type lysozyme